MLIVCTIFCISIFGMYNKTYLHNYCILNLLLLGFILILIIRCPSNSVHIQFFVCLPLLNCVCNFPLSVCLWEWSYIGFNLHAAYNLQFLFGIFYDLHAQQECCRLQRTIVLMCNCVHIFILSISDIYLVEICAVVCSIGLYILFFFNDACST